MLGGLPAGCEAADFGEVAGNVHYAALPPVSRASFLPATLPPSQAGSPRRCVVILRLARRYPAFAAP
jgi:hypothetical protein